MENLCLGNLIKYLIKNLKCNQIFNEQKVNNIVKWSFKEKFFLELLSYMYYPIYWMLAARWRK